MTIIIVCLFILMIVNTTNCILNIKSINSYDSNIIEPKQQFFIIDKKFLIVENLCIRKNNIVKITKGTDETDYMIYIYQKDDMETLNYKKEKERDKIYTEILKQMG